MKATTPSAGRPALPADRCVDRRAFVVRAAGLSLAALVPGCASLSAVTVRPEQGRVRLPFLHHPSLLEPAGQVRLRIEGMPSPIYVLALAQGGFAAVSPICTHQGCTVDIAGSHLLCPCHGSMYDRDGTVVRGPAPRSLRRYAVTQSDMELTIDLGAGG